MQHAFGIEPVGLGPAGASVYEDAGRLKHVGNDVMRRQPSVQPEAVPAGLEATCDIDGLPSLADVRDRNMTISASSAVVSPPSMRCSRDFSAPGSRAATSHDETLSSMAMRMVFSDGMMAGSLI